MLLFGRSALHKPATMNFNFRSFVARRRNTKNPAFGERRGSCSRPAPDKAASEVPPVATRFHVAGSGGRQIGLPGGEVHIGNELRAVSFQKSEEPGSDRALLRSLPGFSNRRELPHGR